MNFFTYPPSTKYTLSECLLKAEYLDFRENFKVTSRGMVTPLKRYVYSPEETAVRHKFLMENHHDPRGYSVFLLLETAEGRRGYLIEEDSEDSDRLVASFVREIPGNKPMAPAPLMLTVSWLRSVTNIF